MFNFVNRPSFRAQARSSQCNTNNCAASACREEISSTFCTLTYARWDYTVNTESLSNRHILPPHIMAIHATLRFVSTAYEHFVSRLTFLLARVNL